MTSAPQVNYGGHARASQASLPSFWLLQAGGWLAFGVAMATSRMGRLPLSYMVAAKTVLTGLGLLASLVLWRLYRRLFRRGISVTQTIVVCALCSYVMAALWTALFNIADARIENVMLGTRATIDTPFKLLVGSVYHAFALFGWSVLYFAIKHHEALLAERERTLRAESRAHAARLEALRYQLNPHFLFNTLNAISTLVVEGRNGEAGRMLSRLSDFLRASLESPTATETSLSEEIELARRYLDIEQVRFGDRLSVAFDIAAEAWTARVPALVLQPLVENAIRHAVARRECGGRIIVGARMVNGKLSLSVSDDGPGLPPTHGADGIGLRNTRARLDELYGTEGRFELRQRVEGGVTALIELPA